MKLGNLFKGLVEVAVLPLAVAADVVVGIPMKVETGKFLTEKLLDKAKDDLNEATE